MQVFSSDVYFTVGTNALLASQKEYYSDLVALVDLGHSFVVIDEHQHRNLKPNTEPVNILLSNNFIWINKNITLSDLTHFRFQIFIHKMCIPHKNHLPMMR